MNDRTTPSPSDFMGRADPVLSTLLHKQRQCWRSGHRTPVEMLIEGRSSPPANNEVILDLLFNEVILRQELGESPCVDEYQQRFPHLAEPIRLLFEVDEGLAKGSSQSPNETIAGCEAAAQGIEPANAKDRLEIPGYQLIETLGRGGMGVVYKAKQVALDRIVAIKVIRSGLHADPDDLARFHTEALAAARLQHPNIAQVHDVSENNGRPFLVLEYVAGGGLDRLLAQGPLSPDDAARLVECLARAVHYAHECGVVHRDLKPANVLVGSASDWMPSAHQKIEIGSNRKDLTPSIKITDFGLAKLMDVDIAQTQTGHILGTPMYMAPEQAAGRSGNVGPATDVYALGVILYECLVGHPPFQGQSPLDTLSLVVHQPPIPPRRMRPKVPRDLETICLKCLEKEQGGRYSTAKALANDLRRYLERKPVLARPVQVWNRAARGVRRHPAGATAIALGCVLLVAAISSLWLTIEKKTQSDRVVAEAIHDAELLRDDRKWTEALAAIRRAEDLLEQQSFQSSVLHRRVREHRIDLTLARDVDRLQFEMGQISGGHHELQPRRGPDQYEAAFAAFGIKIGQSDPDAAGRQVRDRPYVIREQMISALDDCITACESDEHTIQREWLARVVALADPGDHWRSRLRQARSKNDIGALRRLASGTEAVRQPANAVLMLAAMLKAQGALEDAVSYLRRAQQHSPGEFWINSRLASYCIGLESPAMDDAIRYAQIAQALRPFEPGPHFFVGYVLQKQDRTDAAIAAFQRAAELDPDYIGGLVYLGDAFKEKHNWERAEQIYRQAIATLPDCSAAHDGLGMVYYQQKQYAEAKASLQLAVRLAPRSANYHNNLGAILAACGDHKLAIEALRVAVTLDQFNPHASHNLGYQLMVTGECEEAERWLKAALSLKPEFPVAHLNLGRALARLNRIDEAIAAFREAIRLQHSLTESHVSLGLALESKEDRTGALAAYQDAIACDPQNPNAQCYLGLLLLKDGKVAEALTHLKLGHELGARRPEWNRPSAQWVRDAEQQLSKQQSQPPGN